MVTQPTIICPGCGKAFAAFLEKMAKHNSEVVCPKCGKVLNLADSGTRADAAEC
jgi:uncharacterized Zn-finger protein